MNVLVEGIDRAGKSTLVRELKNRLSWDTRFLGHHDGPQYPRYLREYGTVSESVIERGHVSEAVYSGVFGRPDPFSFDELVVLDGIVNTSMVVVYARPPFELALERYAERTLAQTVDREELADAYARFDAWFASHSYRTLLPYRSESWEELETLVERVAELVDERAAWSADMRRSARESGEDGPRAESGANGVEAGDPTRTRSG